MSADEEWTGVVEGAEDSQERIVERCKQLLAQAESGAVKMLLVVTIHGEEPVDIQLTGSLLTTLRERYLDRVIEVVGQLATQAVERGLAYEDPSSRN